MSHRLIVIDPKIPNYSQWLAGVDLANTDVLTLDANQDGLQQIADHLGTRIGR